MINLGSNFRIIILLSPLGNFETFFFSFNKTKNNNNNEISIILVELHIK